MGGFFARTWALMLLGALAAVLIAMLFEISWPRDWVLVATIPSDAVLTDGAGYSWRAPARIPVPEGGITITASGPDRVPVDTLLLPGQGGSTVLITLPYRFEVLVETDPTGAALTLDGVPSGVTPATLRIDSPGAHGITLTLPGGATLSDSFNVLTNGPRTLRWVLPEVADNGMLLVRPGCEGTVRNGPGGADTLAPYMIALREVTAEEVVLWLRDVEPLPDVEDTYRWGRTDTVEAIFPGDYPVPFTVGPDGGWTVVEGMERMPAPGMAYRAALDYCAWLTTVRDDGCVYRLPTETEWTAAALAGGAGPWPWGAGPPDGTLLNLSDTSEVLLRRHPGIDDGFAEAAPVGSFPPNDWGLFDMAGNLWEWCAPDPPDTLPAARGGSWLSSAEDCRVEARLVPDTVLGYPFTGFRVAATPPPSGRGVDSP